MTSAVTFEQGRRLAADGFMLSWEADERHLRDKDSTPKEVVMKHAVPKAIYSV